MAGTVRNFTAGTINDCESASFHATSCSSCLPQQHNCCKAFKVLCAELCPRLHVLCPAVPCRLFACRGGAFVLIPTTDLVFYALGSGEYDEMACESWIVVNGGEQKRGSCHETTRG
jgi:hypothetical protein